MNRPEPNESNRDPYRSVVIVLLAAAVVGTAAAVYGGIELPDPVLLAVAVTLGLAAAVLSGVYVAQAQRARPPQVEEIASTPPPEDAPPMQGPDGDGLKAAATTILTVASLRSLLARVIQKTQRQLRDRGALGVIRLGTAIAGANAIFLLLTGNISLYEPDPMRAGLGAALCLIAAGIAATAVRYLVAIDPAQFPESPALSRGGRAVAWILMLAATSIGFAWADWQASVQVLFYLVLVLNTAFCYGLFTLKSFGNVGPAVFPLNVGVLSVLGSQMNILGSILDSAEQQMGIDLRSTWALSVIRRGLEPLLLGLCLVAWLSTSLTVVGVEEQGLVERLGVPVGGQPLSAGLHIHWPWPIDKVFRIPVQRVQVLEVGHEGAEAPGPEDVLWAVEHAPNEFTLLLGNGRDLITVDAAVQFRIVDAAAWRYHCQNPAQALSAVAYRAVMRSTVNLTLSDALSQNVALLTGRMRAMIQREADALGLGVEIQGFTVGGMHPPVAVAKDYQAVVSAEVRKVTAVVNAQVFRARAIPQAEASAVVSGNLARVGQGCGRGLELPRARSAIPRFARSVFLSTPPRDPGKGIGGARFYDHRFPLPAGWR
jgi:regulator of protease activity HflC (stomatin/prohibitin superfamily)